jgi:intraflagellar transport protein 20
MSAAAALAEQGIHADRNGLHLLPPEQAKEAATLQEECKEFLGKTQQFGEIIADFINVMESRAKIIEAEKLKAIGLGNRVDSEQETRKRKQLEMQVHVAPCGSRERALPCLGRSADPCLPPLCRLMPAPSNGNLTKPDVPNRL